MSDQDLARSSQRYLIRIQFDVVCRIQKYIPYLFESRPGELFERRGSTWKLIGYVKDKSTGAVTSVDN